ncbi:recombinase family protein [Mycobacterium persicum]|uniref:recombinase family protein n=1 Tax=Mycobacterium persicum TaxID=1487726 RepID=UPI000C069B50|nr:recombinase family protein [Mycobacterium persicum]
MSTAFKQVRAACYCRISSDPKDKREGVDRQREDTTALCEVKGWTPAGFYIDNDRSASNGKHRPEWDRLLADVKAGKIDAIAAWDQDRGWRMMHELEELRKFFTELGRPIPLATTGQGDIDLYSPTGVLAAQIKTAVSEHEIAMMKVRQRRAARQKAESGRPQWRKAFGFLDTPDGPVPDPRTAPLVKQAYAALLAGASLKDIAKLFNDAGAHGLNGKPWSQSTVSLFLRAPRNAGLRSHNGQIICTGTWKPLVDEHTWRKTQYVLNAPGRAPGRKSVKRHLLTGVLQCGKPGCGGYLSGMQTADKRIVYACKSCRGVSIRAEFVEPLLYRMVSDRLAMDDAVDLLKAEIHDEAEAEAIRLQLETHYAELDNIGAERGEGLLTGKQAKIATDIVTAKIAALQARQQDQERLRVFEGLPLGRPEVDGAIMRLSPDRLRAVLDLLYTVTVHPCGKGGYLVDPETHRKIVNPERLQVEWC